MKTLSTYEDFNYELGILKIAQSTEAGKTDNKIRSKILHIETMMEWLCQDEKEAIRIALANVVEIYKGAIMIKPQSHKRKYAVLSQSNTNRRKAVYNDCSLFSVVHQSNNPLGWGADINLAPWNTIPWLGTVWGSINCIQYTRVGQWLLNHAPRYRCQLLGGETHASVDVFAFVPARRADQYNTDFISPNYQEHVGGIWFNIPNCTSRTHAFGSIAVNKEGYAELDRSLGLYVAVNKNLFDIMKEAQDINTRPQKQIGFMW